jgi:hypothetical protein
MLGKGLSDDDGGAVMRGVREMLDDERAACRIERPGRGGIQQIALDLAQLRIGVRIADHRLADRFPFAIVQRPEQIPLESAAPFLVVPCQCPTPSLVFIRLHTRRFTRAPAGRPHARTPGRALTLSCPFSPKDPADSSRR